MWQLFGFCRGFRGKPWFMISPFTQRTLCLRKKSRFPHLSATVVFRLQSTPSGRLGGGFGRALSPARRCRQGRRTGKPRTTRPSRPGSAARRREQLFPGDAGWGRRGASKGRGNGNIHSNAFCCSSSFKIMFRFRVLLITHARVGRYLMPASDGCSII